MTTARTYSSLIYSTPVQCEYYYVSASTRVLECSSTDNNNVCQHNFFIFRVLPYSVASMHNHHVSYNYASIRETAVLNLPYLDYYFKIEYSSTRVQYSRNVSTTCSVCSYNNSSSLALFTILNLVLVTRTRYACMCMHVRQIAPRVTVTTSRYRSTVLLRNGPP